MFKEVFIFLGKIVLIALTGGLALLAFAFIDTIGE